MTHKVHPKFYRLGHGTDWDSRWFTMKKTKEFLEEDLAIRSFLNTRLKKALVERIEIERFAKKIHVVVRAARPGFIIGRGGTGAEELKKELDHILWKKSGMKEKKTTQLDIQEIKNPETSAIIVAQNIAEQLEKRIPFRRVLKRSLSKIMEHKEVKGARIEISGRLDGSDIARREWLGAGRLPRITIRSDIDYGFVEALCTYGKIGIKIWIYKGEQTPQN